MKQVIFLTILSFLILPIYGQVNVYSPTFHSTFEASQISKFQKQDKPNMLALHLMVNGAVNEEQFNLHQKDFNDWVSYYDQKAEKYNDQKDLLQHLFYKVHRKVLKRYEQYSTLHDTFESGVYDCLTGTTVYSLLFNALNIDFQIVETNYHIYLLVTTDKGEKVLIESTDPINGFIDSPNEIKIRLADYQSSPKSIQDGEYNFKTDLTGNIDIIRLVGLQYYNASVNAFNSQNIREAFELFEKAAIFYSSPRLTEYAQVLRQIAMQKNALSSVEKRELIGRLTTLLKSGLAVN